MNYEGIFIGGEGGNNPNPPNLDGVMIYKNDWQINTLYEKDEVVIHFQVLYIALQQNINKEPNNNPTEWNVISYFGNNNNVSNYRGSFIQGLVLKQYDSVYDTITNNIYTNQKPNNYVCTTQSNLIIDLVRINNPNSLLPSLFSEPYLDAKIGNSNFLNSGYRYTWTPNEPLQLFTYPFLPDLQTNGWTRSGVNQQGSNFKLDPSSIYAKEGKYRFSAIVNYWFSGTPTPIPSSNDLQSNGTGAFQIEEIGYQVIDRCGLNSPISQPQTTNPIGCFVNQSSLCGFWDVRFGREYGFKLESIYWYRVAISFAIRFQIHYVGPSDPINLRNNYLALSQNPRFNIVPTNIIEVVPTPVQNEYVIPFPIINNLLAESINVSLVNTQPNQYTIGTDYFPKAIKLNGYAQNQKYTLTLSTRIGLNYFINDFQEIRACFQSSSDNINWSDINNRQIIYVDTQVDIQNYPVQNIPLYIQYEGFRPDPQFKDQYVRVVIILIPKPNRLSITQLIIETNGGHNQNPNPFNPYNSFFQIYPDDTSLTNMVWKQRIADTAVYSYPLNRLGNNFRSWYGLPTIFAFLPVVMNNYNYPTDNCKNVDNLPLIYNVPNFMRSEFGIDWCGVKVYTAGTYNFDYYVSLELYPQNVVSGIQYNIVICRNNPCEILYTQRLNVDQNNIIEQRITTSLQLINSGDFIYPLITWNDITVNLNKLKFYDTGFFKLTPQ